MRKFFGILAVLILAVQCGLGAGIWQTWDVPGATSTFIYGIKNETIYGGYSAPSEAPGFIYNGTTLTSLTTTWEIGSMTVTGFSGDKIVGTYMSAFDTQRGFIYENGSYTNFNKPGAYRFSITGIDGDTMVGWYDDSGFTY